MPYIKPEQRKQLDIFIDEVSAELRVVAGYSKDNPAAIAGLLNYACTRIILNVLPERRYWVIALITGVLENIKQEFYRRYAAPYEDEQIAKNGDVY